MRDRALTENPRELGYATVEHLLLVRQLATLYRELLQRAGEQRARAYRVVRQLALRRMVHQDDAKAVLGIALEESTGEQGGVEIAALLQCLTPFFFIGGNGS